MNLIEYCHIETAASPQCSVNVCETQKSHEPYMHCFPHLNTQVVFDRVYETENPTKFRSLVHSVLPTLSYACHRRISARNWRNASNKGSSFVTRHLSCNKSSRSNFCKFEIESHLCWLSLFFSHYSPEWIRLIRIASNEYDTSNHDCYTK